MSKSRNGHRYNLSLGHYRDLWGARPCHGLIKSPFNKLRCRRLERRALRIVERTAVAA